MFQSHHQWFLPPTIGIRAPFVRKQKCFGIYLNFQSCQKQVFIIPPCRVHPYELTGAKISLIGAGGSIHAPLEYSALSPTRIPRAPEVEDECSIRAPYPRRAAKLIPSRAVKLIPSRASSRVSSAPQAEPQSSRENIPQHIPGSTPANRPTYRIDFGPVQPISDPFPTNSDRFPTVLSIPDRSTVSVLPNSTPKR